MNQERATDEAFVIEPDGRIHDLARKRAMPTTREVRAVLGPYQAIDLDGRQGLALLHGDEGAVNHRATQLTRGREIRGRAIVIAKRLVP